MIAYEFCSRYIDISKLETSPYRHKILLRGMAVVLQILSPIIPNITDQLWTILGFEGRLSQSYYDFSLQLPPKNYKISLFLNIVKAFQELKME
ncbi:MAG: class I tRNA ligase family protein [bacterium]|nr:class I tRNA ligase family protein [bacterium]